MIPEFNAPPFRFYPRMLNFSNVHLILNEEEFLSQGFKFTLPPVNVQSTQIGLIADFTMKKGLHQLLLEYLQNNELQKIPEKMQLVVLDRNAVRIILGSLQQILLSLWTDLSP